LIDPFWRVQGSAGGVPTGGRTIVIGGRTINIGGGGPTPAAPFSRLADSFYPYDRVWRTLARTGLTHIHIANEGYSQGAFLRLCSDRPDDMLANSEGMLCVSVTNDSASLDRIRASLDAATRAKQPAAATTSATGTSPTAGSTAGAASSTPPGPPTASPASVLANSPSGKLWLAAVEGKAPVFAVVQNAPAVAHLLAIAEKYKDVKWVLVGDGGEFIDSAERLKGKGFRVVLSPALRRTPTTRDRVNVAKLLHGYGVEVAFAGATRAPLTTPDMPLFAVAMAVKTGLPRDAALAAVTMRPAALLGVDKDYGSLEVGKSASFVVFDGDPLSADSRLRQVYVEGRLLHED
jgi:hypothetical protein